MRSNENTNATQKAKPAIGPLQGVAALIIIVISMFVDFCNMPLPNSKVEETVEKKQKLSDEIPECCYLESSLGTARSITSTITHKASAGKHDGHDTVTYHGVLGPHGKLIDVELKLIGGTFYGVTRKGFLARNLPILRVGLHDKDIDIILRLSFFEHNTKKPFELKDVHFLMMDLDRLKKNKGIEEFQYLDTDGELVGIAPPTGTSSLIYDETTSTWTGTSIDVIGDNNPISSIEINGKISKEDALSRTVIYKFKNVTYIVFRLRVLKPEITNTRHFIFDIRTPIIPKPIDQHIDIQGPEPIEAPTSTDDN